MPKGPPRVARDHLEKAREAARAAVEAYNKPGSHFRTAHYVVLIIMAWTALFHAIFFRNGRRPWYRKRTAGGRGRYVRVDGEPKHWDLSECLVQYYQDRDSPVRANLRFLIGLRNKIEHRHLPALDPALYGECQAALMNLDELMVKEFGARYSMSDSLAVSLQFSRAVPPQKATAARSLLASGGKTVLDYIDSFRNGLREEVVDNPEYSFRVYLVPKLTGRPTSADISVEFVPYDPSTPEQIEHLKKVTALIKERQVPIANLGLLKPGQVATRVAASLPFPFNTAMHARVWRHYGVRPPRGAERRERTKGKYCVFDQAHQDYLYTPAWVEFLCKELADPARYAAVTGKSAPLGTATSSLAGRI